MSGESTGVSRKRQASGMAMVTQNGMSRAQRQGTTTAQPTRAPMLHARGLTIPEIARALDVSARMVFRRRRAVKPVGGEQ